ncbi:hypothetical protein LCGC14_0126460 [marine sediment metagenome]
MAVKRQVVIGVASLAALYVGVSNALGLGELKLESALNQPLSATISLQGAEGMSPSDILVSLANPEAFEKAGIDRPFFLSDLRFIPVVENDRMTIRVESNRPVREPYLNFLVELRRPNGRMLREYTLLLDPPLFNSGSSPIAPQQPQQPVPQPLRSATRPAPVSEPERAPAEQPAQQLDLPDLQPQPGAGEHLTVSGDTLWDIAAASRPANSVSIRSNMLAIKALNPDAFVNDDIDRLRVGQPLVLPTPVQLGVEPGSERAADESQSTPETAGSAPFAPAETADAQQQAVAAQESAPQEDSSAPLIAGKLRIEEPGVSAAEADAAELLGRLQALEARFNVLLSELDSRDRQIASLQAELEVLREAQSSEETGAAIATGTLVDGEAGAGASSVDGSADPQSGAVAAEILPAQEEAPEESFLSKWWPALLAFFAFLLGVLVTRMRSRSAKAASEEEPEQDVEQAHSGLRPGTALIGSSMIARSVTTQPPKPVDPLDGVELYITYGRFAEARVMLDKAIADEPERLDLRFKQLRVLAELGDAKAFEEQQGAILAAGGDADRIEQIKSRFPALFDEDTIGLVEHVDHVEPLFDGEMDEDYETSPEDRNTPAMEGSQLNLNDFTLDPDWELIEGLTPGPAKKNDLKSTNTVIEDEAFESSLHEFPEVEELDDAHEDHFPGNSAGDRTSQKK